MMKGTIEAVSEGIVKQIARIDLNAGCKVKSKGINMFATFA